MFTWQWNVKKEIKKKRKEIIYNVVDLCGTRSQTNAAIDGLALTIQYSLRWRKAFNFRLAFVHCNCFTDQLIANYMVLSNCASWYYWKLYQISGDSYKFCLFSSLKQTIYEGQGCQVGSMFVYSLQRSFRIQK